MTKMLQITMIHVPSNDNDTNISLNKRIEEQEILAAIKSLKNNKSHGIDSILNEHLKHTSHLLLPMSCNLLNLIFDTGIIPEVWTVCLIKPVYKKFDENVTNNNDSFINQADDNDTNISLN